MHDRPRSRLWLGASLLLPLLILASGLWLEFGGLVDSRRREESAQAMEVLARLRESFDERLAKAASELAERSLQLDEHLAPVAPFLRRRPEAQLQHKAVLSAAGRIGLEKEALGQVQEALPFLDLACKDSGDSRLHLARARCLWKLERRDEALSLLQELRSRSEGVEPGFLLPVQLRAAALAGHLLSEAGRSAEAARIQAEFYAFRYPVPIEAAESSDRLFGSLGPLAQDKDRRRYLCLAEAWRQIEIHGIPPGQLILPGGTLIGKQSGASVPVLGRREVSELLKASLSSTPEFWQVEVLDGESPTAASSDPLARLVLTPLPLELTATPTTLLDSRLLQLVGRGLMVLALLSFVLGNLLVWRMLRRELELSRLRSDFIDLISHELRTPLTALSLKAEMLAHGEVRPDKVGSYQRGLKAEVDRLSLLVGEILDFARREKGRTPIEKRKTSARALLARGLGEARPALRLPHQRVRVDAARDLPTLEIDLDLLARALRNLLENASKYAPAGSEIQLQAELCEGGLRLSVCDQGPGVPRPDRDRIFEPFIRGDNAAGKPGSGLGLALVRQAVEAHGGQVRVEDAEPGGARFSVILPLGTPKGDAA